MRKDCPLIIAEAGVNHNGDLELARELVSAASDAGADYVKFQTFSADETVVKGTKTAAYQTSNTGLIDQHAMIAALELSISEFEVLAEECRRRGITFLSTPFDYRLAQPLLEMGMDRIKVPSGEITNVVSLEHFATLETPIILSTGMSTLAEVGEAVNLLQRNGARDITLLQCTSEYPAPYPTINLRAMQTLATAFQLPVGYSDHTMGDHIAIAATALGATVIEKHFTLDRTLPGPDHKASLEPDELARMVKCIRETSQALGDGVKAPSPVEIDTAVLVRRSWHAARELSADTILTAADLTLKRPADGLMPKDMPLGRKLKEAISVGEPIRSDDLV